MNPLYIKELTQWNTPLDITQPTKHPSLQSYLHDYGLTFPSVSHSFGTLPNYPFNIKVHLFSPPRAKGTVLLLHGYLDHVGVLSQAISFLTSQGWKVFTFDWPGHGLSQGERASVDDFSTYTHVLYAVTDYLRQSPLPLPFHVIAHSTGCAICIDGLLSSFLHPFQHILFNTSFWLLHSSVLIFGEQRPSPITC